MSSIAIDKFPHATKNTARSYNHANSIEELYNKGQGSRKEECGVRVEEIIHTFNGSADIELRCTEDICRLVDVRRLASSLCGFFLTPLVPILCNTHLDCFQVHALLHLQHSRWEEGEDRDPATEGTGRGWYMLPCGGETKML